jgi:hypothetical protein
MWLQWTKENPLVVGNTTFTFALDICDDTNNMTTCLRNLTSDPSIDVLLGPIGTELNIPVATLVTEPANRLLNRLCFRQRSTLLLYLGSSSEVCQRLNTCRLDINLTSRACAAGSSMIPALLELRVAGENFDRNQCPYSIPLQRLQPCDRYGSAFGSSAAGGRTSYQGAQPSEYVPSSSISHKSNDDAANLSKKLDSLRTKYKASQQSQGASEPTPRACHRSPSIRCRLREIPDAVNQMVSFNNVSGVSLPPIHRDHVRIVKDR